MIKTCPNCKKKVHHTVKLECWNCRDVTYAGDIVDDFADKFSGTTAVQKVKFLYEKGLELAGVVLQKDGRIAIVSELGRVEWFNVDEIWRKH